MFTKFPITKDQVLSWDYYFRQKIKPLLSIIFSEICICNLQHDDFYSMPYFGIIKMHL